MEQNKFYQIKNVTEHEYTLVGCDGSVITRPIQEVDKTASAFTIQDAKKGDVLFAENFGNIGGCVFLFNMIDGWEFGAESDMAVATGYCCICITGSGNTDFGIQGPDCVEIERVHPATKEQRDLLFTKMKETGYRWDAENKELKKIEDEIEIPFGAKDSELQEVTYYIPKGFHAEIEDDKVVIKKGEKSVAWSEEDEGIVASIEGALEGYEAMVNEDWENEKKWLKSLKNRATWKPSEEQIHAFEQVYEWYNNNFAPSETLTSLYSDLKIL